jgi:hypothetical protein
MATKYKVAPADRVATAADFLDGQSPTLAGATIGDDNLDTTHGGIVKSELVNVDVDPGQEVMILTNCQPFPGAAENSVTVLDKEGKEVVTYEGDDAFAKAKKSVLDDTSRSFLVNTPKTDIAGKEVAAPLPVKANAPAAPAAQGSASSSDKTDGTLGAAPADAGQK